MRVHYSFGLEVGCGARLTSRFASHPSRVTCRKCLKKLHRQLMNDLADVAGNLADPPMKAGDIVTIAVKIERKK